MKPNYIIGPLIGMVAFGGYYVYWKMRPHAARAGQVQAADEYAGRDGTREAEADLAAGKLAMIESGPRVSWDAERVEIARTKYGVELRRLETSTEAMARYVDAFNRVMRPPIIARHGRGFFDALHQEAMALQAARKSGKND